MAEWIRMRLGMVVRVELCISVLDFGGDRRREGAVFKVNAGHPIVINGIVCVRAATRLFPNYFGISCF